MTGLTTFDKINLAACAMRRARPLYNNQERFGGEYDTAMLWKGHRVQTDLSWSYVTQA